MAATPQAFGVGSAQTLTDGATITLDQALTPGNCFKVTLAGSRTLNLKNCLDGQVVWLWVTQDGTGSRVLTVTLEGTASTSLTSGTPLSTAASSVDLVAVVYRADLGKVMYYPIAKAFA